MAKSQTHACPYCRHPEVEEVKTANGSRRAKCPNCGKRFPHPDEATTPDTPPPLKEIKAEEAQLPGEQVTPPDEKPAPPKAKK